jgi:hypothetical protein
MELADAADISKSYASEILSGKRHPSRPLAIHIYRQTGWRHASIADLTDEQLAMLEEIEPWSPKAPTSRAAA